MTVYKSAVDTWLAITLVGAPVLVVILGIYQLSKNQGLGYVTIMLGIIIGMLIALISIPCEYVVTEKYLEIRTGLKSERISYDRIKELSLSSDTRSAPAHSLKRVRIDLEKGSRLISPKNREEFIEHIETLIESSGQPVAGGDATRWRE